MNEQLIIEAANIIDESLKSKISAIGKKIGSIIVKAGKVIVKYIKKLIGLAQTAVKKLKNRPKDKDRTAEPDNTPKVTAPRIYSDAGVALTRNVYDALEKNLQWADKLFTKVASAEFFSDGYNVAEAEADAELQLIEAEDLLDLAMKSEEMPRYNVYRNEKLILQIMNKYGYGAWMSYATKMENLMKKVDKELLKIFSGKPNESEIKFDSKDVSPDTYEEFTFVAKNTLRATIKQLHAMCEVAYAAVKYNAT